jgi:hypothetical protein
VAGKVQLFDDAEWGRLDSFRQAAKSKSMTHVEWLDSLAVAVQKSQTSLRPSHPHEGSRRRGALTDP